MTFSTFQKSVHVDEFHRCVYTLLYFLVCLSTFHSKYGIAKVVYRCNAHTRRAKLLTLSVILSVCARARINVGRFLLHTVFAKKKRFPITRDRIETPRLASCVYARALSGPAIAQRRTSQFYCTFASCFFISAVWRPLARTRSSAHNRIRSLHYCICVMEIKSSTSRRRSDGSGQRVKKCQRLKVRVIHRATVTRNC